MANMEAIWHVTRDYMVSDRRNPSPKSFVAIISDATLQPNEKSWLIQKCNTWPGAQTPHAKQVVAHTVTEIQTENALPPEPVPHP